ncbi:MAG: conserved protein of unknown function [Nitrospira sp.]
MTPWLNQGKAHHQAGRLAEAEQAYRQALTIAPRHPDALHLLGLLSYRMNRLDEALERLNAAVEEQPASPLYWFNLGVVAQKAGRLAQAVTAYEKAVSLNPRHPEALMNLGNALRDQGSLGEAIEAYRKALAINPTHPELHNNLGVALQEQGAVDDAIGSFRRALEAKPQHVEALNNLGLALMEAGTLREAIGFFQRALALMPGYQKALYNLGIASIWVGDDEKAVSCFSQIARARHDHGQPITEQATYRSRIKHEVEQTRHLLDRRLLDEEYRAHLDSLIRLQRLLDDDATSGNRVTVSADALASIAPAFNRMLHCEPPQRIDGSALNGVLDVAAVESRYLGRHPEVTFVDGLVNDVALEALRRFCLDATIWKKDYENGYCGAFLGDGFASPLLLQIAEELRLKFPRIFTHHRLTQAWAFKQDSARRGLNIHADAAAVNVNFWITPDEANLDPSAGGLVVYDKEAPKDWNFKDYNSDRNKPKILAWLKEVGAEAIKIPYRANRAVIFNSDLFHESDHIAFKDDYRSRRINITLLYGHRLKA